MQTTEEYLQETTGKLWHPVSSICLPFRQQVTPTGQMCVVSDTPGMENQPFAQYYMPDDEQHIYYANDFVRHHLSDKQGNPLQPEQIIRKFTIDGDFFSYPFELKFGAGELRFYAKGHVYFSGEASAEHLSKDMARSELLDLADLSGKSDLNIGCRSALKHYLSSLKAGYDFKKREFALEAKKGVAFDGDIKVKLLSINSAIFSVDYPSLHLALPNLDCISNDWHIQANISYHIKVSVFYDSSYTDPASIKNLMPSHLSQASLATSADHHVGKDILLAGVAGAGVLLICFIFPPAGIVVAMA